MSIAERRAALYRMKEKAKKVYPWMGDKAVKLANHLKNCSCYMCGNPRKYGEKTHRDLLLAELVKENKDY